MHKFLGMAGHRFLETAAVKVLTLGRLKLGQDPSMPLGS